MITNCDLSIGILCVLFSLSIDDGTEFIATLCTLDRCPCEKTRKSWGSNAGSFRSCSGASIT